LTNQIINNIKEFGAVSDKENAMATTFVVALKRKGGGENTKVMLRYLKGKLSFADFERFLDNTPDGEDFWPAYVKRKIASDEPGAYDADKYAKYILEQRN